MRTLPTRKYQHALVCTLFSMLVCCSPLNLLAESYDKNTELALKEQVVTDGGIVMTIERTIRLTSAPISAMHPFMKSIRLDNGDLLVFLRVVKFLCTGESVHRPKYPPVKVARSTDEGKTWSVPVEVHPTGVMPVATLLDNNIIVAFTGRGGNRVAASKDNGLTWHCRQNLMFTGQSPNFSGHNTILPLPGGRALLIYTHNHRHPDNKKDFANGNRYAAELIGTFVAFKPVPIQD